MKEFFKKNWKRIPRSARKIFVFIAGWIVVLAGVAMLALPGPGWAAIFLGFAILATEFTSAKQVKDGFVDRIQKVVTWYKNRNKKPRR